MFFNHLLGPQYVTGEKIVGHVLDPDLLGQQVACAEAGVGGAELQPVRLGHGFDPLELIALEGGPGPLDLLDLIAEILAVGYKRAAVHPEFLAQLAPLTCVIVFIQSEMYNMLNVR